MTTWRETLEMIAKRALDAEVFASVRVEPERVVCEARDAAAPAFYRVDVQKGEVCVSMVTPDRWLSQSIEQELVHTGDKIPELLDEELAELDYRGATPRVDHYRSDDKLYTFKTPMGMTPQAASTAENAAKLAAHLLAYEAAFRHLGDMQGGDDE